METRGRRFGMAESGRFANMVANAGNARYHAPRGTRASPLSAGHPHPLHNGIASARYLCYGATTMQFPWRPGIARWR